MTAPLAPVRLDHAELVRVTMPLVAPFTTSFGTQSTLDKLLVRVVADGHEGWGECGAPSAPVYSEEYVAGAAHVLEHHLVPRLAAAPAISAEQVADVLGPIHGHRMAKAAVEMALLDVQLRSADRSLADHLGAVRDRVPAGVSLGIPAGGAAELTEQVAARLDEGYRRIKCKIMPGHDVELVAAVRDAVGDRVPLQVDANAAYTLDDLPLLARLDDFGLELIEQPLAADRLLASAAVAEALTTPICLDESIHDAAGAADAIALGACSVVNIKAGRVGGCLEAVRVHDVCAARGIPVWCGGMLETGLGRAANVALAALPNFRLPGDTSASDRYFATDLTEPFVLVDGHLAVPTGPGLGRTPRPEVLEAVTTSVTPVAGR